MTLRRRRATAPAALLALALLPGLAPAQDADPVVAEPPAAEEEKPPSWWQRRRAAAAERRAQRDAERAARQAEAQLAADASASTAADSEPAKLPPVLRRVRRTLDLDGDFASGAPRVRTLTTSAFVLSQVVPLEDARDAAAGGDPASEARARARLGTGLAAHALDRAAAAELIAALALDPTLEPAWTNLAGVLRRAHEPRTALAVADHALELAPRSGVAWFQRALALESLEEMHEADDAYLRALELDPSLWLPARNPVIIGNERASRTLHRRYVERHGTGGVLLQDVNAPAGVMP